MTVSVIDNGSHVNRLGDAPAVQSSGKLKIRGNTSASSRYPKKQYRIKLLTETGEKNSVGLMGMTASDDWILNGTPLDRSHPVSYTHLDVYKRQVLAQARQASSKEEMQSLVRGLAQ